MIPTYKTEYAKGLSGERQNDAHEDIESFFTEYVEQGVKDLELFRNLMLIELEKGISLELTVKGFASPLAKSDYNVNLTKRRIGSLINYLSEYNQGVFIPYLNGTSKNGAKITFKEVPFGEYTANKVISDNPNDQKNSVFSRSASLERKIEIQSISLLTVDSIPVLSTPVQLHDFGKISKNEKQTKTFVVTNNSQNPIEFDAPEIPCECNTVSIKKTTLQQGESTEVNVVFDPTNYAGNTVKSVYLKTKTSKQTLRLVVTAEVM
jgi:hypothetical protein